MKKIRRKIRKTKSGRDMRIGKPLVLFTYIGEPNWPCNTFKWQLLSKKWFLLFGTFTSKGHMKKKMGATFFLTFLTKSHSLNALL